MGKLWNKIKTGIKHVAPFGGRMLGADKDDKKKFDPRQQYWGGSKEESKKARDRYWGGEAQGDKRVDEGVARGNDAAEVAASDYDRLANGARNNANEYAAKAGVEGERAAAAGADYSSGRKGSLSNAAKLESLAANAPQQYQQTAQSQFSAQQDANQRQAMGLAAGRGAAGLRTALASSTTSNAQAAQQAQITQAQEMNALLGMQQSAYGQAAGIRQAQGAQDLGAAGMYSGREGQYMGAQATQQGVQGNAIGGAYNAQANAANAQVNSGTAERGQYLNAQAQQGNAELNAGREFEGQRQANEKYNYTQDWFPLKRFNAPA